MEKIDFDWLEEHVFHRTLEYGEKSVLEQMVRIEQYRKNDCIIREGEEVDGLFLLREGGVAISHASHGEKIRVGELHEGAQLGDMSLFDAGPASATVTALGDCVIFRLPAKAMAHLLAYRRELARDIMMNTIRQLSSALRQMNQFNAYAHQYMQQGQRV